MAVDVLTSAVIAAPPEVVAAYAADPANAPAWYANIDAAELLTPPPFGVGARVAFRARFLGRSLSYTYEVTAYEPGTLLVMRTADGPFPMETTYTWATHPDGTTMTLRNRGEPAGFARAGSAVLAAAMRRANTKDLAALGAITEALPRERR